MIEEAFTKEEYSAIKSLTDKFTEQAKHPITFDKLLSSWKYLASSCSSGYDDCIEEYLNDLSSRDLLQKIINNVPQDLSSKIYNIVSRIDKKFIESTVELKTSIRNFIKCGHYIDDPFWYKCIPKKMGSVLKQDFEIIGVMK